MTFSIERSQFDSVLQGRRPYLAVLECIRVEIAEGRLQPGDQLPPQRDLARRLGLAVGTVTKAYSEASRQRLVSTEVGRGTFVLGAAAKAAGGEKDEAPLDLTFNHVAYEDAHETELVSLLTRTIRRVSRKGAFHYDPAAGRGPELEHAAGWLATMGHTHDPGRVIICNGVQHGLSLILQSLSGSGASVLTEQLGYPGIGLLGRVLGFRLQGVVIDDAGLDIASLRRLCEETGARILVCAPTLHNPTNSILPLERRQQLADVAREHDLTIIEYDVNGIPVDDPLPSLTVLAPERSFFITSTWKATPMGAALGYIIAPSEAVERLVTVVQATTWTPSPLLRKIVTAWIADGTAARTIAWHKSEIAERLQLAEKALGAFEIRTHPASYNLWLTLPDPWRREVFIAALQTRGVTVSAADVFIVGRSIAPHALRLNLGGLARHGDLEKALSIMADVLRLGPQPRIVTA